MTQITLFAPDVTCDHCIATIQKTVATVDGATFLEGDPDSKSFAIDIAQGAVLDRVAEALAAEGYPLGPASPARAVERAAQSESTVGFSPALTIEKSEAGASVTYTCPCGSSTEHYTYDRSKAAQDLGSCCDHHLLIEPGAGAHLRERLGEAYEVNVQAVQMPWGQPMEAAFATRRG